MSAHIYYIIKHPNSHDVRDVPVCGPNILGFHSQMEFGFILSVQPTIKLILSQEYSKSPQRIPQTSVVTNVFI